MELSTHVRRKMALILTTSCGFVYPRNASIIYDSNLHLATQLRAQQRNCFSRIIQGQDFLSPQADFMKKKYLLPPPQFFLFCNLFIWLFSSLLLKPTDWLILLPKGRCTMLVFERLQSVLLIALPKLINFLAAHKVVLKLVCYLGFEHTLNINI